MSGLASPPIAVPDRHAYYRAALLGLAFLDGRRPTGRRFGPDADARWSALAGDLSFADRVDLLLADADAEWPGALGARSVFAREGVAGDDAFGPGWEPLRGGEAADLWREIALAPPPATAATLFERAFAAWGLRCVPFTAPAIGAAERVVVAGPSAVTVLGALFAGRSDLDWAAQVRVVATPPAHRQLAGLAAAVAGTGHAPVLLRHDGLPPAAERAALRGTLVVSEDADAADRTAAESLAEGWA